MGTLEANGASVKKGTVEVYLHNLAHIFDGMGADDSCLDILGKINVGILRQLRAYAQSDPPPDRIRPYPIALLHK